MKASQPQRGVAARTENKVKRRNNILKQAREMIASDGYGAFTLAQLAEKANVTVPTIHNLIGNKSAVFQQLVQDMVARIDTVLELDTSRDPIATAEIFIDNLIQLYADDESFYKAAFVIGEREKLFEHDLPTGVFSTALNIAHRVCQEAITQGYLKGDIPSLLMADRIFAHQRLARHDWVHGYIDLTEYRLQVLTGMYITFAADAVESFRVQLLEKITSLHPEHQ